MKNLFIYFAIIACVSCDNNDNSNQSADSVFDHLDIFLKNSSGIDILGSDKYPIVTAEYLINGTLQNPTQGCNPFINNYLNYHFARIFLNKSITEEYPITYIHWNATDTDTIKAHFTRGNGNVLLDKAWIFENNVWKEISIQPFGESSPSVVSGGLTIVK